MKTLFFAGIAALSTLSVAQAASIVTAPAPGLNSQTEIDFYASRGGGPDFFQNFETGFSGEQLVNGSVGNGLSISGIGQGGTPPKIESGDGSIGGSNPIDRFALELADDGSFTGQNSLVLTFDQPLAYLSFFMIDATVHQITAGGLTDNTSGSGASGDNATFNAIAFEPNENVTQVSWLYNAGGSQGWAIDNIGYGFQRVPPIPVPAALPLFASAVVGFGVLQRLRRRA